MENYSFIWEIKDIVYTKNKYSCVKQIRTIIIHCHIEKGKLILIVNSMIDQEVYNQPKTRNTRQW